MGQYFKLVNLDKREYLHPHKLDSGLKLMEIAFSLPAQALAVLLADVSGGDAGFNDYGPRSVAGRWAGDRVVVTGDYSNGGSHVPDGLDKEKNLYTQLEGFTDISALVIESFRKAGELPEAFSPTL